MPELSPQGSDDAPLSLTDAATAYANVTTEEEPKGQPETEETEVEAPADEDADLSEDSEETEEGDPEDEGQADEESDEEPESDLGRFVASNGKVKLPDGTVSTVADLIQGNLRDRDYRQKTMEAAEVRKTFEAKSSALTQQEQEIAKQREFNISLLKSIIPPPPDPAMLQTDPMGYMTQKASHDQWVNHLQTLTAEQQRAEQARQAKAVETTSQKAQEEWGKLVERVPDLKDAAKADAFAKDAIKFGASAYGFTEQELMAQLPGDHRLSLVMRDAIRWQKFQANKGKVAKKVEGRPSVQKGGTRLDPTRTKARDSRAAMERLNQTGSLKDGIAALLATEGKG